jgi:hypothetical protein
MRETRKPLFYRLFDATRGDERGPGGGSYEALPLCPPGRYTVVFLIFVADLWRTRTLMLTADRWRRELAVIVPHVPGCGGSSRRRAIRPHIGTARRSCSSLSNRRLLGLPSLNLPLQGCTWPAFAGPYPGAPATGIVWGAGTRREAQQQAAPGRARVRKLHVRLLQVPRPT